MIFNVMVPYDRYVSHERVKRKFFINSEPSNAAYPVNYFNSFMTESLSYRNQSIDLLCKSMDWFLYDTNLHQERINALNKFPANQILYWKLQ